MPETPNISLLQSQYLYEIEKVKLEIETHGDYTREGLLYLTNAAKLQLRLSCLTAGETSARHKKAAYDLIRTIDATMRRLGLLPQPEAPQEDEAPQKTEAPAEAPVLQSADTMPQRAAAKPNEEMPGFNIEDYIIKPGSVSIDAAAIAAPAVVSALKSAVHDNFQQLFPNLKYDPNAMVHHRLLYGPPGSGKTYLCKGLASYVNEIHPNTKETPRNSVFMLIPASEIKSRYVGTTEHRIRAIFEAAAEYRFSVICIDEVDELCPSRSDESKRVNYTTTLLELIDGVAGKTKSVIILATNHPEKVDSALVSRVGHATFMDYPEAAALANYLRSRTDIYSNLGETEEQHEDMVKLLAHKAHDRHFSFRNMDVLCTNIILRMRSDLLAAYPEGAENVTKFIPLTWDVLESITDSVSTDFNPEEYARLREYSNLHGG